MQTKSNSGYFEDCKLELIVLPEKQFKHGKKVGWVAEDAENV